MIAPVGSAAIALALGLALLLGSLPLVGAARGQARWMAAARPLAASLFGTVAVAFVALAAAFASHDFSIAAVARHSHTALPLMYRLSATWGGHEGSMLLWLLVLAGWTFAASRGTAALPATLAARLLAVLGLVNAGFLLFVLATSNPFATLSPVPVEGADLNPLLQDPGMIAHPPLLYMGYVGFAVAFAWAAAVLLEGRLEPAWARWVRPWTTAAWCCLTLGIALGSFWAYYELGWGGWWFWDPVENASFMPWLVGTALMHTLAVTEKRDALRAWTLLLAIAAFALSLLGTFLVRSGVVSSVHSFASDPARGLFILALLALVVGASLLLYAWRAPRLGRGVAFFALSRESLLLANNLLLVVATATVMLGTLYPLALEALTGDKVSVGAPYFEAVLAPLFGLLMLVLGAAAFTNWKRTDAPALVRRLRLPLAASLGVALACGAWMGEITAGTTLGLWMACWVVATLIGDLRARRGAVTPTLAGMWLAHAGVAAFAFGVAMVHGHQSERLVTLGVGQGATLDGHTFTFHGVRPLRGPNYGAVQALVVVTRGDDAPRHLLPEKRLYDVRRLPMTEAAIDRGFTRDLYVSLGEPATGGAWVLRLQHKPFIGWIWGGCVLMALGGLVAATDRRLRRTVPRARAVLEAAT